MHNVAISIVLPSQPRREVICSGRRVLDPAGAVIGAVVSMRDVTDLLAARHQVEQLSTIDRVTGLPSRDEAYASLQARVQAHDKDCDKDQDFAFLLLDIDHFSDINDTFGHTVGDSLLRELAQRLRGVALGGSVVARLGGDEFAVMQSSTLEDEAIAELAERVMSVFGPPFELAGVGRISARASVGISNCCSDQSVALTAAEILSHAHVALNEAKRRGRGQWVRHHDAMSSALQTGIQVGKDLADALASGSPEAHGLSLVYQPQVRAGTGALAGLEALARWDHPSLGPISPVYFVRVAEETGSAVAFGDWVLRTACGAMAEWLAQGIGPPTIAVNISALEFRSPGFEDRIRATLKETGVPADRLELEITESFSATEWNEQQASLRNLAEFGISWSLDDFGTGYSSLLQLRSLPFGRLKIAQEFVRDMLDDAGDAAIVRATIDLSRALGMEVVAEGVETAEQLRVLRSWGCDVVQGYWFDRPLSYGAIQDRLLVDSRRSDRIWVDVSTGPKLPKLR